jgi:hypothetical protein
MITSENQTDAGEWWQGDGDQSTVFAHRPS